MKKLISLLFILLPLVHWAQGVTFSGKVIDGESGETIPYVNLYDSTHRSPLAAANAYGFFSVSLPRNTAIVLAFTHVGYRPNYLQLQLHTDTSITVGLTSSATTLREVTVSDSGGESWVAGDPHVIYPSIIRDAPALLGEKDVIKTLQLLPGVQRGIEGSTSFFVRGAGADQNLIVADEATIYNANHLFGFMSVFNADAVKNINFSKGSFPARYGGRVGSVTEIQTRDGNKNVTHVTGGIGLLSARLTVDGPLMRDKTSYLLSARRSFLDVATKPFMSKDDRQWYRLFDLNGKISHTIDESNSILLSLYTGGDKLSTSERKEGSDYTLNANTNLGWVNRNISLRWNRIFSDKVFNNITVLRSHYKFFADDTYHRQGSNGNYAYADLTSAVEDYSVKQDLDYYHSNTHTIRMGSLLTYYRYSPRIFYDRDVALSHNRRTMQRMKGLHFAAYAEDEWTMGSFALSAGLRYAYFNSDTDYSRIEPRARVDVKVGQQFHLNASYTRSNQFMHLLSNTGVGLPTDLWVPAVNSAPAQRGDLFTAGVSREFSSRYFVVGLETYRRYLRNIITYSADAEFLDPDETSKDINWEENITVGKAEAYGTEVFVQKKQGKLTGSLAYTLAWVAHQFDDINNGRRYFPRHDSRHNISTYVSMDVSKSVKLCLTWLYSSGNALTVPQAYYYGNFATGTETATYVGPSKISFPLIREQIVSVPYTGPKNSYRGEAYHRLDISCQFFRKKQKYERYWEIGLFNAYNRKNPFYYYLESSNDFTNNGQRIDLKKKSLFPILPSVSYNFKF